MQHCIVHLLLFLVLITNCYPQSDTTSVQKGLEISGYADVYYTYDFNYLKQLPDFIYSHNHQNNININHALIALTYHKSKVSGNLAFQSGTFADANYANEPGLLKLFYEADASLELTDGIFATAGIFPSHLGFESAISMDNWTLTRSLAAENSPYYETGLKVSAKKIKNFIFAAMLLNGWQNIKDNNQHKSLGYQLQYKYTDKLLFNYSSILGNEQPDSVRSLRFFNNFYLTYKVTKRIDLIVWNDIGYEQVQHLYKKWWNSMVGMCKIRITQKVSGTLRQEWFRDSGGVIIPYGCNVHGTSLNIDYSPAENFLFRVEGKVFNGENIRYGNYGNRSSAAILTISSAIKFN